MEQILTLRALSFLGIGSSERTASRHSGASGFAPSGSCVLNQFLSCHLSVPPPMNWVQGVDFRGILWGASQENPRWQWLGKTEWGEGLGEDGFARHRPLLVRSSSPLGRSQDRLENAHLMVKR